MNGVVFYHVEGNASCSICQNTQEGDTVAHGNGHTFHEPCLRNALFERDICPVCSKRVDQKAGIFSKDEEESTGSDAEMALLAQKVETLTRDLDLTKGELASYQDQVIPLMQGNIDLMTGQLQTAQQTAGTLRSQVQNLEQRNGLLNSTITKLRNDHRKNLYYAYVTTFVVVVLTAYVVKQFT